MGTKNKQPSTYEEWKDEYHDADIHGERERQRKAAQEIRKFKEGEGSFLLGMTDWREGKIDPAETYFLGAVKIIEVENPADPLLIRIYNELSFLEQARGAWIGPYGSLIGWIGLLEQNEKLIENGHLKKALDYSNKSFEVWNKLDPAFQNTPEGQNFYTHALDVQGMAYTAAGRFEEARKNHQTIVDKALSINDHGAAGCAYTNLGWAFYFQARQEGQDKASLLAKAEENFRNSLKQHEELGIYEHVGHALVLSNLARTLEAEGKKEEAKKIYQECLAISQKTHQDLLAADVERHLASLL